MWYSTHTQVFSISNIHQGENKEQQISINSSCENFIQFTHFMDMVLTSKNITVWGAQPHVSLEVEGSVTPSEIN